MLAGQCPSCGAPVQFRHAVAVATVCTYCRSTVVRSGNGLVVDGSASVFARDLSPIQLGARGKHGQNGFVVLGVLRKARENVRWNEWFLLFDDGTTGWLGEGNGEYQIYDQPMIREGLPSRQELQPGATVRMGRMDWVVVEVDEAAIVAADGELPEPVTDGQPYAYADLRTPEGDAATLDFHGGVAVAYPGFCVTLKELQIDPLRLYAGWSSPEEIAAKQGVDVVDARSLPCPNCGGTLQLNAPGASSHIECVYCGSSLQLNELGDQTTAELLDQRDSSFEGTSLTLGDRGKLDGIEWQIIGVMRRYVEDWGSRYYWTEYLLFNPYEGYRFLLEDETEHFWHLVERLPAPPTGSGNKLRFGGKTFRLFQAGKAYVDKAVGEFTWRVVRGDVAGTRDYIAPPHLLSIESEKGELAASLGRWVPAAEVARAFGRSYLPSQGLPAPAQPNPYMKSSNMIGAIGGMMVFFLLGAMLFIVEGVLANNKTLYEHTFPSVSSATETFVGEPFDVPGGLRKAVRVQAESALSGSTNLLHVQLVHDGTGTVHHVNLGGRTRGSGWVSRAEEGKARVRLEIARAPTGGTPGPVTVKVVHDPPYFLWAVLLMLASLTGPVLWYLGRQGFETSRWSQTDLGGG